MFSKTWLRDVSERVLASGFLGFLVLISASDKLDISTLQAAATAGLLAAASAAKGLLASLVGDSNSASADPAIHAVVTDKKV